MNYAEMEASLRTSKVKLDNPLLNFAASSNFRAWCLCADKEALVSKSLL